MRSHPRSGRLSRGSVSYLGPPTAPSNTASLLRQLQARIRQRIAGCVITRAADGRVLRLEFEAEIAQDLQHLHRLGDDLGTDAVTRQYRNLDCHVSRSNKNSVRSAAIRKTTTAPRRGGVVHTP